MLFSKYKQYSLYIQRPFYNKTCNCFAFKSINQQFVNDIFTTYKNIVIITDSNIQNNLQYCLFNKFGNFNANIITLKANVKPLKSLCIKLKVRLLSSGVDFIIAIGSGTVNDIAKYTSHLLGVNYCVFATALSMNGYTSQNASLIEGGIKQSFNAHLPIFTVFDLSILSSAPQYLTMAGFLDCLATITANFDWILHSIFTNTQYNGLYYKKCLPIIQRLCNILQDNQNINSIQAIKKLLQLIILSGLAMTAEGSSIPASGGEHQLTHILELKHPLAVKNLKHGHIVGYFIPIIYNLQKQFVKKLQITKANTYNYTINTNDIIRHFDFSKTQALKISQTKHLTKKQITKKQVRLLQNAVSLPMEVVKIIQNIHFLLEAINKKPKLTQTQINHLTKITPLSRDRFSVLDSILYIC